MGHVYCLEIGPEGYTLKADDLRSYLRDTLIVTGDIWEPIFMRAVSDYQCLFDRVVVCLSDVAVNTATIRGKTIDETITRINSSLAEYVDYLVTDDYVIGLWGSQGVKLAAKYKIDYAVLSFTKTLRRIV